MKNKDINNLINIAKNRLLNPHSKKEILKTFMDAGILNKNFEFSDNYPHLKQKYNKNETNKF